MDEYCRLVATSPGCLVSLGFKIIKHYNNLGKLETIPEFLFYVGTLDKTDLSQSANPLYWPKTPQKFYSGEIRIPYHHKRTYVSIVYPGTKFF